jgi:hypothetical protein
VARRRKYDEGGLDLAAFEALGLGKSIELSSSAKELLSWSSAMFSDRLVSVKKWAKDLSRQCV